MGAELPVRRAAISAMTPPLNALIRDVEAAISSGDQGRRLGMLRSMTDLFADQASRLSETQVAAFDAVILRLARDVEAQARAELSERVADVRNGPRDVVRDLAFDASPEVAGPVLARSEALSETDLVQVAEQRGQGHLMAMTRRRTLTERVTDVIVVRGDESVVRSVARNDGARFSQAGHRIMVDRATSDPELRATLETRVDVPAAYRDRLVALATAHAREALGAEFGEAAEAAVGRAAAKVARRDDALLVAEVAVSKRVRAGDLDEGAISGWLAGGQETEALAGLARLAGVPSRTAIQAFAAETSEPLLILVRAAGCGWRLLKLVLTVKAGASPDPESMRVALEAFQTLSVATAQRVVRFASTRDQVQALERAS